MSPFMGGLAVELELISDFERIILSDIVPDLSLMWDAILHGWLPPEDLSESEYRELKDSNPSPLRGFAGFGGSFGGKWFGGYGRISEGQRHRNGGSATCAQQVARGIKKDAIRLRNGNVTVLNGDYRSLAAHLNPNVVVYADPPYAGTLGYAAAGKFDTETFWHDMRKWSRTGAEIFVSEEKAPSDWYCIWESEVAGSMHAKDRKRVEKLWVLP